MRTLILTIPLTLAAASSPAAEPPVPTPVVTAVATNQTTTDFDAEVQTLKEEVLELNRDLFLLEEELLFPANTQVAFFLSMDVGEFFALDAVELKVNDETVASYLYTDREVHALFRGGVQRLHVANLKAGEHELTAFFTGIGPHERPYRRAATMQFEKDIGPKYVELKIHDDSGRMQPEFAVRDWE